MKKITLKLIMLITTSLLSQNQGDIAFVGYNGDGDDDFAIVALTDISANTTIYFTDSEPNVAGTGMNDTAEGVITWVTGGSIINAGTIIVFAEVDNDSNTNFGVSVGVITRSDSGFSLAVGVDGDEIFATLGNPATDEVTVWLAGIEVHDNGRPENFEKSGLTPGTNYLVIDATQSKDGGKYVGARTGKTVSEYRALVNDEAQWETETENGLDVLPFNTTAFTFLTLSTSIVTADELVLSVKNQKITTNTGVILNVYNMLGQKVANHNLVNGVYIVTIKVDGKLLTHKVAF